MARGNIRGGAIRGGTNAIRKHYAQARQGSRKGMASPGRIKARGR